MLTESDLTRLAQSFPSLEGAPGADPWNPHALDGWALSSGEATRAAAHAARFCLAVSNPAAGWLCGPFDFHAAYQEWRSPDRDAFLEWANDPQWGG